MGYLTHVTGEIKITPPASWAEVKDSRFLVKEGDHWPDGDVRLVVEETEVETDEGVLTKRIATAVTGASEDSYKGYGIQEDLQELVASLPGHDFRGVLEGHGEEYDDIWRLHVDDQGNAVKVKAQIVWPS